MKVLHHPISLAHAVKIGAVAVAALAALAFSRPAHAAGSVEVSYVKPESFTDAGRGLITSERNLERLSQHLQGLGAKLPDGQTLRIEVLDVDLAGEQNRVLRQPDLRVMKGSTDWPRINLRYTLLEGSRTVASGEERVADMGYLIHPPRYDREALGYERRMLERWFDERFASAPAR